jgi:hypothetical protein
MRFRACRRQSTTVNRPCYDASNEHIFDTHFGENRFDDERQRSKSKARFYEWPGMPIFIRLNIFPMTAQEQSFFAALFIGDRKVSTSKLLRRSLVKRRDISQVNCPPVTFGHKAIVPACGLSASRICFKRLRTRKETKVESLPRLQQSKCLSDCITQSLRRDFRRHPRAAPSVQQIDHPA